MLVKIRLRTIKFQVLSDFKRKILQLVRFQMKLYKNASDFETKVYNVSDFVLNFSYKKQISNKNVHSQNRKLTEFTP